MSKQGNFCQSVQAALVAEMSGIRERNSQCILFQLACGPVFVSLRNQ